MREHRGFYESPSVTVSSRQLAQIMTDLTDKKCGLLRLAGMGTAARDVLVRAI